MRVFNIVALSSKLLASDNLHIPDRLLVTLYGGTSNQRELIVHDLLLDESSRRLSALGVSHGYRARRGVASKKRKSRVRAEYDGMLPVFEIDQLLDKRAVVGDALGIGQDLIDLFAGKLCFRCPRCDIGLLDGSPEMIFSDVLRLSQLENKHDVFDAKSKCFFFARFDLSAQVANDDNGDCRKRSISLLRYAACHGYRRVAIHNIDSKDTLRHPVQKLYKFSISDFERSSLGKDLLDRELILSSELEEVLPNASTIDILLDSCSFDRFTQERLQDDYKRLTDFGCAVGVLSFEMEGGKSGSLPGIFRVGEFFYCPSCGALFSRQECDESRLPFRFTDPDCNQLEKSRVYFGDNSLDVLFQMPFCEWLAWFETINLSFLKNTEAFNRLCKKLESLLMLDLGMFQYSRLSGSLSSGEFFKLSLLAITHRMTIEALVVIEEPSRFISPDENESVVQQMKEALKQGVSLLVSEQNAQIARGSDWVIELAGEDSFSWRESLRPVYQGYPRHVEEEATCLSALHKMQNINAFLLSQMLDGGITDTLIVICGKSGSGKTTFLQDAVSRAERGELKAVGVHSFSKGIYLSWGGGEQSFHGQCLLDVLGIRDEIEKQFFTSARVAGNPTSEVYAKSLSEALALFAFSRKLSGRLKPYVQIGLGHLSLNDAIRTLSRDELLRIRLVTILWQAKNERLILALDQVFAGMEVSTIELCLKQIFRLGKGRIAVLVATNQPLLMKIVNSLFDKKTQFMSRCYLAIE